VRNIKLSVDGIGFVDKEGRELGVGEGLSKVINRIKNWGLDAELLFLNVITWCPLWSVRRLFFRLAGVKMGKGTVLHTGVRFYLPSGVEIGEDTVIGDRCFLDGRAKLKIGSHVDVASQVLIYNSEHDVEAVDFRAKDGPVEIEDYVFVGPRAVILPGVKVGKGAVVAAGAVVTKDVSEKAIVGGVPARKISERKLKELNYKLGRARLFQ
jgi:maltose O-acetyltransferase